MKVSDPTAAGGLVNEAAWRGVYQRSLATM